MTSRVAVTALWAAGVLGTLHAASSICWAIGGQWLLATVGQWAMDAATGGSRWVFVGLFLIRLIKLAAAWIPLLAQSGLIPWLRFWRVVSWVGGPALILYGGANAVLGTAVLVGWIDSEVTDHEAMVGHAFIWSPHFALWGAALTVALMGSRGSVRATR